MMDTETQPDAHPVGSRRAHLVSALHLFYECPNDSSNLRIGAIKCSRGERFTNAGKRENRDYLRKKLGVVSKEQAVYLASPKVRVRGIVDEVLFLDDGTMAPLDFKYTEYREKAFRTHAIQVTLYGLLIEEVYQAEVTRGYVAYIRGGSKVLEVPLSEEIKRSYGSDFG